MKTHNLFLKYSTLAILVASSSSAFAAGFMLEEQNAVQTGDFGAGGAAIAEDASTAWFNPAGLVRINKPQIVVAGNEIVFHTHFTGNVDQSIPSFDTSTGPQPVNNLDGGTNNFIPTFHAAYPLTSRLVAGFSVTTPFGLSTDYGSETMARYSATTTKLKTIDLSPSFGVKLNDQFSAGLGFDEQRLLATLDGVAGLPSIENPAAQSDTVSHSAASDWAKGWHGGFLYQPTTTTRFGLSYFSKMAHHASGYSQFIGPLAGTDDQNYATNDATSNIYLPASTMLSGYHEINNRWAVLGTVIYTQWNIFKDLTLNNVAATDGLTPTPITVSTQENYRNTWRVSVGGNYKVSDQWLLRSGVGFDQTPTNNNDRNLRLADGNRYALAVGTKFQATKQLAVDAGWTHEIIKSAGINNTTVNGVQTVYVNGKSHNKADIVGLQMTYSFA